VTDAPTPSWKLIWRLSSDRVANGSSLNAKPPSREPPASKEVIGIEAETPVTEAPIGRDTLVVPNPLVAAMPVTDTDSLKTKTPPEAVA
jgi:hypothetical protein